MKIGCRFCLLILVGALLGSGCRDVSLSPSALATRAGSSATPLVNAQLTPTNSALETQAPAFTPTATEAPPTSTPSVLQVPNHTLVLAYNPPGQEVLSDIWLLRPPYHQVVPFRAHDADYAYCCPRWSPDGQWIAYVRTSVTQPVSSLWIGQPDSSVSRQIGDEMQRGPLPAGIQAIVPFSWSRDGQKIILSEGDDLYAINIETGEKELLDFLPHLSSLGVQPYAASSHFAQFNSNTDQFLLYGDQKKDERLVFLTATLGHFDQMALLTPPEDYSPVGQGGISFLPSEVSLSPDGRFLLLADYQRHTVQERLWRVDIELNQWDTVVSQPVKAAPNNVLWSTDQHYVAWWRADRGPHGEYSIFISFLDTTSWSILRDSEGSGIPTRLRDGIIGWTTDSQGRSGFAVLENKSGRGLVLLKPDGGEKDDVVLVSYDQLAQQLPFKPEEADWAWQP